MSSLDTPNIMEQNPIEKETSVYEGMRFTEIKEGDRSIKAGDTIKLPEGFLPNGFKSNKLKEESAVGFPVFAITKREDDYWIKIMVDGAPLELPATTFGFTEKARGYGISQKPNTPPNRKKEKPTTSTTEESEVPTAINALSVVAPGINTQSSEQTDLSEDVQKYLGDKKWVNGAEEKLTTTLFGNKDKHREDTEIELLGGEIEVIEARIYDREVRKREGGLNSEDADQEADKLLLEDTKNKQRKLLEDIKNKTTNDLLKERVHFLLTEKKEVGEQVNSKKDEIDALEREIQELEDGIVFEKEQKLEQRKERAEKYSKQSAMPRGLTLDFHTTISEQTNILNQLSRERKANYWHRLLNFFHPDPVIKDLDKKRLTASHLIQKNLRLLENTQMAEKFERATPEEKEVLYQKALDVEAGLERDIEITRRLLSDEETKNGDNKNFGRLKQEEHLLEMRLHVAKSLRQDYEKRTEAFRERGMTADEKLQLRRDWKKIIPEGFVEDQLQRKKLEKTS